MPLLVPISNKIISAPPKNPSLQHNCFVSLIRFPHLARQHHSVHTQLETMMYKGLWMPKTTALIHIQMSKASQWKYLKQGAVTSLLMSKLLLNLRSRSQTLGCADTLPQATHILNNTPTAPPTCRDRTQSTSCEAKDLIPLTPKAGKELHLPTAKPIKTSLDYNLDKSHWIE